MISNDTGLVVEIAAWMMFDVERLPYNVPNNDLVAVN